MTNKLPTNFELERYGLYIRFVQEEDADFILSLRTNEKLGKYINATSTSVKDQQKWIQNYKIREANGIDYYFMFEKPKGTRLGVCRIYDVTDSSFTIGSWVFSPNAPIGASILGDIITRELGFHLFPNSTLLFDVKKANLNVNRYQAFYKPTLLRSDIDTNYYSCPKENFNLYKTRFLRNFNIKD